MIYKKRVFYHNNPVCCHLEGLEEPDVFSSALSSILQDWRAQGTQEMLTSMFCFQLFRSMRKIHVILVAWIQNTFFSVCATKQISITTKKVLSTNKYCVQHFFTVPPCAGAHAFSADQPVCEPHAALEGVWFDPEHHGSLPAGLQVWARPFA